MDKKKSNWTAVFVYQKLLKGKHLHRRLYFRNLRNEDGLIIRENFVIDESESIKAGGRFEVGDTVSFYADEDFKNIEFCYPYYGNHKEYSKLQKECLKIIKERGKK